MKSYYSDSNKTRIGKIRYHLYINQDWYFVGTLIAGGLVALTIALYSLSVLLPALDKL